MYMPSKYRRANHVGRVRVRLAKAIVMALASAGFKARCEPHELTPSSGYWKQSQQDVMRWEGFCYVEIGGKEVRQSIASWDRMTECLKGFSMWRDGWSIEVGACNEGVDISERYTCEFEIAPTVERRTLRC